MRFDAEIIVPDLPLIDTDSPGFNILITGNRQRLPAASSVPIGFDILPF